MATEKHISYNTPDFITSLNTKRASKFLEIKSKKPNAPLRIATDFEGPLVLGDTAADIMSLVIRPIVYDGIDHGGILFNETYDWYMAEVRKGKIGRWTAQEGTDINLTLPFLIARGVTENNLDQLALQTYRKTPGADELLTFLNKEGIHVTAVTTAWQEQHEKIGNELGLDGVIGTAYPLDAAINYLRESGRYSDEIEMTLGFLQDMFRLNRECALGDGRGEKARESLRIRIKEFYVDQLGVRFTRQERFQGKPKTVTAEIIEGLSVIGDRAKARTALNLFRDIPEEVATVAIGDGLNDKLMLEKVPYSIGLNGPSAVIGAKIGVVTDNIAVLSEIYSVLIGNPKISIGDWIVESKKRVGSRAIIHRGGPDTKKELLDIHRDMRKALRGKILI